MNSKNKKVMLGMSGGVDSSAAAIRLIEKGYDVSGVTMILKPEKYLTETERTELFKEAQEAEKICRMLGIPHFAPNFSGEFEEHVIKNFISSYLEGCTPNPCVQCNINLKFGSMLDFAKIKGCDMIATGHYAKLEKDESSGRTLLKKAPSKKDQSYFLYGLSQKQLSSAVFPIWDMTKEDARALADKYRLPVANKPDSQEICFIKNNDYISFLEKYAERLPSQGNFIDTEGKAIAKHGGIHRYTIGQRKGLGVSFGEPMYVKSINACENTVMLSRLEGLFTDTLYCTDINLIPVEKLEGKLEVEAKIRYQAKPAKAVIESLGDNIKVTFYEKQKSVTPGQKVVFYLGDCVLGGGTII